jgi:hypothetical protein
MRVRLSLVLAVVVGGCGGTNGGSAATTSTSTDGGISSGGGDHPSTSGDMGFGGPGTLGDGGVFTPPPADMGSIDHGPPITSGHVTTYGGGGDFRDVSTDAGGNIWAVTPGAVYYFANGNIYSYDQGNGLARGASTYNDAYWCIGSTPCPTTDPVSFSTVAGGNAGQAFVGNIGFTGDRLDVNPSSGAVLDVVGMQVTSTQQSGTEELSAQQAREIASWKTIVDLNGPMNGRAYFGGFHGLSALSGMNAPMASRLCGQGCAQYEEHVHPFTSDGTQVLGRDIRAIALTTAGDLWVGDADSIWFMPQRSAGAGSDFFQPFGIPGQPSATYLDVFPGVTDDVYGIGADAAGGVWVASNGNGLAYLAPSSYAPTYFTTATGLPQNTLTGLAIDVHGDIWMGTSSAGVARYTPSTQSWQYLTTGSGLPSNDIRSINVDRFRGDGQWIWLATDNGVAVYKP